MYLRLANHCRPMSMINFDGQLWTLVVVFVVSIMTINCVTTRVVNSIDFFSTINQINKKSPQFSNTHTHILKSKILLQPKSL